MAPLLALFFLLSWVVLIGCAQYVELRNITLVYGTRITVGFKTEADFEMGWKQSYDDRKFQTVKCSNNTYDYEDLVGAYNIYGREYPDRNGPVSMYGQYFTVAFEFKNSSKRGEGLTMYFRNQEGLADLNPWEESSNYVYKLTSAYLDYDQSTTTIYYWIRCKKN